MPPSLVDEYKLPPLEGKLAVHAAVIDSGLGREGRLENCTRSMSSSKQQRLVRILRHSSFS